MGGGRLTRRHGYLWLAAVLLTVLLIVVLLGRRNPAAADAEQMKAADSMAAALSHNDDAPHSKGRFQKKAAAQAGWSRKETAVPERPPEKVFRKEKELRFDLNSADSTDLVQLYNIGPAFARRIIRYRERLGGFVEKEQLWEVYGMDSARYNDIAPHLAIGDGSAPQQIDLNSATIDQLKRHPYLDYYQAKAIVQLRDRAGSYRSIEELQKIPIIDNETYEKIAPYLTCSSQPNK